MSEVDVDGLAAEVHEHTERLFAINGSIAANATVVGRLVEQLERMETAQTRRDIIAEAQTTFLKEQTEQGRKLGKERRERLTLRISMAVAVVALLALLLQSAGAFH